MLASDFDFELPPELIAQSPSTERDRSRLLVVRRASDGIEHRDFRSIEEFLQPGDLLVMNDSKVIPARLHGVKVPTAGEIEFLLIEENSTNDWLAMARPGKRLRPGSQVILHDRAGRTTPIMAEVIAKNPEGHCRIRFSGTQDILSELETLGEIPLPPYISRTAPNESEMEDRGRYQTVYASVPGSVAAPTAGLHFTEPLLDRLHARGVKTAKVTLHVGLGTFAPMKADRIEDHVMHEERFELSPETCEAISDTRAAGGRIFAVGTTSVRVLESAAAAPEGRLAPIRGRTRIFIHPPFRFRVVDALITNFHLPRSTLLMLVSAFAAPGETSGRKRILAAYAEAVRSRYRFFSYGDAMLIL